MLRYGTGDADNYPANHQEGILVCNQIGQPGSSDTFVHTENVQNGTTYYYSAFTYETPHVITVQLRMQALHRNLGRLYRR